MTKIEEVKKFLESVGMPKQQQADVCCLALLTLASIKPDDKWVNVTNEWIRIHDIIQFAKENYGIEYAENSRETIRKQAMHPFRRGALIEDNGKATNSPNYRYRLTEEACNLLKYLGSDQWDKELSDFCSIHESLIETYSSKKEMQKMPVKINVSA